MKTTPTPRTAKPAAKSAAAPSRKRNAAAHTTNDLDLPQCGPTVWARVARLHGLLQQNRRLTSATLERELETNRRTIKRTIGFMRDSLGAPLEFDRRLWSYRYVEPWPFLPQVGVRFDEAYAAKLIQQLLPSAAGSPLGDALRSLLRKVALVAGGERHFAALEPDTLLFPAAVLGGAEQRHLPALHHAIEQCREMRIVYRKPGDGQPTEHVIRPHLLRFIQRQWVLLTHDVTRAGAQRTFVLKRIADAQPTGATFERPAGFDPAKILAGNFGAFTGSEDHCVRVRLRGPAAADARESAWHKTQELVERPGGSVEIALRLNNLVEVKHEILRWGELAEAIEPAALRTAVRESLTGAAAHYRNAA